MQRVIRPWEILTVSVCLLLVSMQGAYAYIDPGTGSYVLQVVVASLLAAAFVVRSTWSNIKRGFAKHVLKRSADDEK
ncbi:MAG: hypothetical protein ABFD49_12135 [Armatimonadota bacterium]|nr:hypothetical protein [bacterium]